MELGTILEQKHNSEAAVEPGTEGIVFVVVLLLRPK